MTANIALLMCLTAAVAQQPAAPEGQPELSAVQAPLVGLIDRLQVTSYEFHLEEIAETENGRVQVADYSGSVAPLSKVRRFTFYLRRSVDGRVESFDIQDVLLSGDSVLQWQHPGFPGVAVTGSRRSPTGQRIAADVSRIADPIAVLQRILRTVSHAQASLEMRPNGDVVVTLAMRDLLSGLPATAKAGPLPNGSLEIVFSSEHGLLPVAMQRRDGDVPDQDSQYLNGTGYEIDYGSSADARLPIRIIEDRRLAPGITGVTRRTWEFTQYTANDASAAAPLLLPEQCVVHDIDQNVKQEAGEPGGAAARTLGSMFGKTVRIVPAHESLEAVARSAAGRSPDLPEFIRKLAERPMVHKRALPYGFLMLLAVGLLVLLAAVWRRLSVKAS